MKRVEIANVIAQRFGVIYTAGNVIRNALAVKIEDIMRITKASEQMRREAQQASRQMRDHTRTLNKATKGKVSQQRFSELHSRTRTLYESGIRRLIALERKPWVDEILEANKGPPPIVGLLGSPYGKIAMQSGMPMELTTEDYSRHLEERPLLHWQVHSDMMKAFHRFCTAHRKVQHV